MAERLVVFILILGFAAGGVWMLVQALRSFLERSRIGVVDRTQPKTEFVWINYSDDEDRCLTTSGLYRVQRTLKGDWALYTPEHPNEALATLSDKEKAKELATIHAELTAIQKR